MPATPWVVATLLFAAISSIHAQTPPSTSPEVPVEAAIPAEKAPPAQAGEAETAAPDGAATKFAEPVIRREVLPAPSTAAPVVTAPSARSAWWTDSAWWLVLPTWLLALVSIALVLYTARLWKATSVLLQDVRATTRKELRSYVALDDIFFSEAAEGAAGVQKLRIRNFGQTPASRMSIWCERASHLPQEGVKPFYDAPILDGQLLHPVQAFTLGLAAAPLYRLGKPGFYTYGRIIYNDIYGQWWVTRFCHRYEGDGSFVPHGDYNSEEGPFETPPA